MARSLKAGAHRRNATLSGSLCDAIISPEPGRITLPIALRLCGPGIVVTDDEALHAMAHIFSRLKLVAEPGGAVAVAAALFHPDSLRGDDVIVTISGGNVDPDVFMTALTRYPV
jgi:threonine dehydratase